MAFGLQCSHTKIMFAWAHLMRISSEIWERDTPKNIIAHQRVRMCVQKNNAEKKYLTSKLCTTESKYCRSTDVLRCVWQTMKVFRNKCHISWWTERMRCKGFSIDFAERHTQTLKKIILIPKQVKTTWFFVFALDFVAFFFLQIRRAII